MQSRKRILVAILAGALGVSGCSDEGAPLPEVDAAVLDGQVQDDGSTAQDDGSTAQDGGTADDGGMAIDVDGGALDLDGGMPVDVDGGALDVDGGMTVDDGGVGPEDAGAAAMDAGAAAMDAGAVAMDAGAAAMDAGAVTPPTGFRITNLDLVSPRVVVVPLIGCADVTQMPIGGFSVNDSLDTAIRPMSAGGGATYSLHVVNVFRPLAPGAPTSGLDIHLNAACMESPTPDACMAGAMPDFVSTVANSRAAGSCFAPVAADVNTRAGGPTAYAPTVNSVAGPCFVTDEGLLTVTLSGIAIPLTRARVSASYSGSPVTGLVTGVVTGFLSERAAADVILPATLPLVGGDSLYQHLQAGGRTTTNTAGRSIASGCNVGRGAVEDDADTLPDGTRGFWFFLNFQAERVSWSGA